MLYLNVATVINKAATKFTSSAPLRAKMVGWFNEVAQDVLNQPRTWHCLGAFGPLPITDNTLTIPDGAGEITGIEVGGTFLTPDNQLTDKESIASDSAATVIGYHFDGSTITLIGATTETSAILHYETRNTTDYTDSANNTIFPANFENLFITGVRVHYYDFDKDGRYTKEETKYAIEMRKVKAWDNRRKPALKHNPHGYVRA
jgi:hypothetical protein